MGIYGLLVKFRVEIFWILKREIGEDEAIGAWKKLREKRSKKFKLFDLEGKVYDELQKIVIEVARLTKQRFFSFFRIH